MVEQLGNNAVRCFFREPMARPLEDFKAIGPVDEITCELRGFTAQCTVFGSLYVERRYGNATGGITEIVG